MHLMDRLCSHHHSLYFFVILVCVENVPHLIDKINVQHNFNIPITEFSNRLQILIPFAELKIVILFVTGRQSHFSF